jgi:hypothetical protein
MKASSELCSEVICHDERVLSRRRSWQRWPLCRARTRWSSSTRLNVEPILQTGVPAGEVALGLITTFILGWFAGVLIATFYNLGFRKIE